MKQKPGADSRDNIILCKEMSSQSPPSIFSLSPCFQGQSIILNVTDNCYLYFYVLPLLVSGALGCSLMLSLMSKCGVYSAKIQRITVITAYVPREEFLYGKLLYTPSHLQR